MLDVALFAKLGNVAFAHAGFCVELGDADFSLDNLRPAGFDQEAAIGLAEFQRRDLECQLWRSRR